VVPQVASNLVLYQQLLQDQAMAVPLWLSFVSFLHAKNATKKLGVQ